MEEAKNHDALFDLQINEIGYWIVSLAYIASIQGGLLSAQGTVRTSKIKWRR